MTAMVGGTYNYQSLLLLVLPRQAVHKAYFLYAERETCVDAAQFSDVTDRSLCVTSVSFSFHLATDCILYRVLCVCYRASACFVYRCFFSYMGYCIVKWQNNL
jgi:hypothetical protein